MPGPKVMVQRRCGNCGAVEVVIRYWRRREPEVGRVWTARASEPWAHVGRWDSSWHGAVELVAAAILRRVAAEDDRSSWFRAAAGPVRFRVVAGP
jgi:anti-sigma factor RsiW